jgi:hypothetical protein
MISVNIGITKIITVEANITAVNFGPYDNRYLLLGFSDGILLGFDSGSLDLILADQIYEGHSIDFIDFEPANSIIIGSN